VLELVFAQSSGTFKFFAADVALSGRVVQEVQFETVPVEVDTALRTLFSCHTAFLVVQVPGDGGFAGEGLVAYFAVKAWVRSNVLVESLFVGSFDFANRTGVRDVACFVRIDALVEFLDVWEPPVACFALVRLLDAVLLKQVLDPHWFFVEDFPALVALKAGSDEALVSGHVLLVHLLGQVDLLANIALEKIVDVENELRWWIGSIHWLHDLKQREPEKSYFQL